MRLVALACFYVEVLILSFSPSLVKHLCQAVRVGQVLAQSPGKIRGLAAIIHFLFVRNYEKRVSFVGTA